MSTVNRNVKFLYFAPRLSPPAPLPRARLFPRFSPPAPPSRSLARGFLCHFSLPCPTALLSAWLFWHFSSSASRHALSPRGFLRTFFLLSPLKNESSRLCRFNLIGLIIKLYRRFKIMVKIFLLIILTRQSIYGSICNTKSLTDQSKEGIWHLKHLKNCQMTRKN